MSDFGRVPLMDIEEPAKEEKEIFDKPTAKAEPKKDDESEKKMKLKEHLARCRVKSAEVRKAKATEKKKNKRPVGRPKKVKEQNINMEVSLDNNQNDLMDKDQPLDSIQEQAEDKDEVEIFKQKDKLIQVLETPELIPPPVPKAQPAFDMDMLLNKFDERMNDKLKAFQVPANPSPAVPSMGFDPNILGFVSYMKDQEEKIRNEERNKYVVELEQKKNESLLQNTRKYFSKLPPRQFQAPAPVQPRQNDIWDDLLNPKRK
tara:strand:- start:1110 stop:1889 length:780 start_codon:yes stop_codon:yes gene_type:complete